MGDRFTYPPVECYEALTPAIRAAPAPTQIPPLTLEAAYSSGKELEDANTHQIPVVAFHPSQRNGGFIHTGGKRCWCSPTLCRCSWYGLVGS